MALPEAQLISSEQTIRELEFTSEVKLTRKSLVRWLSLSLGLISPNESRTLMLDILDTLFYFHFKQKEPDIHEILERVGKDKPGQPSLDKAVRYHLLQLKKKGIIERKNGKYRFVPAALLESPGLADSLEANYKSRLERAFVKIKKALQALEKGY